MSIIETIDAALRDYSLSGDAMRWAPDLEVTPEPQLAEQGVLFIGGPWDGQRRLVEAGCHTLQVRSGFGVPVWWEGDPRPDPVDLVVDVVQYSAGTLGPAGERVFVAAGYRWDAPGVPGWLGVAFPRGYDWCQVEPGSRGRWRARWRMWERRTSHDDYLYVLAGESRWVTKLATSEAVAQARVDVERVVLRDLELKLEYLMLPGCVVPDCTEKGRYVFKPVVAGRLAGRDWEAGDEIRICPRHGHDIYRVVPSGPYRSQWELDGVAEWLRADLVRAPVLECERGGHRQHLLGW